MNVCIPNDKHDLSLTFYLIKPSIEHFFGHIVSNCKINPYEGKHEGTHNLSSCIT